MLVFVFHHIPYIDPIQLFYSFLPEYTISFLSLTFDLTDLLSPYKSAYNLLISCKSLLISF